MSKKPNYVFDDELYHHGIIGQMWGRRRFQNEDGSWTPAGRERYGEGEDQVKKAKADFKIHKQKAEIKSQKQLLKDKIAAKEERNRIKEQAKTAKLARKEQAKVSKVQAANYGTKLGNTKKMSDEDLQNAISRLRLEAEYNKNYALASHPNGMLARADRFFEGPTGKVVRDIAVATIPNVANTVVSKTLDSKLKYANDLDREKARADIDKTKADTNKTNAEAENARSKANQSASIAEQNRAKIARDDRESVAKIKLEQNKHKLEVAKAYAESQRLNKTNEADIENNRKKTDSEIEGKNNQYRLDSEKQASEQKRLDEQNKAEISRQNDIHANKMKREELDLDTEQAKRFGVSNHLSKKYGDPVTGSVMTEIAKQAAARNEIQERSTKKLQDIGFGRDYETQYERLRTELMKKKMVDAILEKEEPKVSKAKSSDFSKNDFVNKQDVSLFRSLSNSGKSLEEISRRTGFSIETIRRYLS